MEISGRTVLVTGTNRGLGRALALACAGAGAAEVIACARDPRSLDGLRAGAGPAGKRIRPMPMDVTRDADVRAATLAAGPVDILVNNAGTNAVGGVLKGSFEDIRREVEVNYLGLLRVVRGFAPAMVKRGDGLIVNVGSHLGKVSLPLLGTYSATKAALLSLTQALRGDLAGTGVRAIAVLPGTLDTDMARGFAIPKMAPEAAAAEILEAIRAEAIETPIGDEARGTFAALAKDPLAIERAFARIRA